MDLVKEIKDYDFIYIYVGTEIIRKGSGLWNITIYIPKVCKFLFPILTKEKFKKFIQYLKENNINFKIEETEMYKKVYGNHYIGVHIYCPLCGGDNMFPDPGLYGVGHTFGFACSDCTNKRRREIESKGYKWDSFNKCWIKT